MAEALFSGAKASALLRIAKEKILRFGSPVETPLPSYVLCSLAGTVIGWCAAAEAVIRAGDFPWGLWPEAWRYADSNLPMIHSADGFYFIAMAKQALANGFSGVAPFAQVTAFLAKLLSTPVENMAFQVSFLTHIGLALVVAFWGNMAKMGRLGVFLACLLVPLVPAWLERGGPGQFDTDLAIVLFLQIAVLFMVKASLGLRDNNQSILWLFGAIVSFGLLGWMWWGANALGLAIPALVIWAMFFLPLHVVGVKVRLTMATMLALWGILILLFPDMTLAPRPMAEFLHGKVASYLGLPSIVAVHDYQVYGFHTNMLARSVQELASVPMPMLLERLGGGLIGGVAMLTAALVAIVASPALRFPMVFALVWVALGSSSLRLVYLGAFPLCLAVGLLPRLAAAGAVRLPETAPSALPLLGSPLDYLLKAKRPLGYFCGVGVSLALIFNCFQWRLHHGVEVRWDRSSDALLEPLRQDLGDGSAYMWNWWDDGFFLMARLGAKATAHFNGGGTNPLKGYIPGHSFVMDDHELAARWMRFFAVRGQAEAIQPAIDVWGPEGAWSNVEKVLAGEEVPGVEEIDNWREWFFPKGKVYWYIPGYIFGISNWWIPLGLSRDPDPNEIRPHIERIRRQDFVYNPQTKALTVDMSLYNRGYKDFGMVINTDETPLKAPWPTAKAPYIAYSEKNGYAYITDQIGIRTLPLYMMAPGGPTPARFRQISFDPALGGVWEITD